MVSAAPYQSWFIRRVLLPTPSTNRPPAIACTSEAAAASASGERANNGVTLVPTIAFSDAAANAEARVRLLRL